MPAQVNALLQSYGEQQACSRPEEGDGILDLFSVSVHVLSARQESSHTEGSSDTIKGSMFMSGL